MATSDLYEALLGAILDLAWSQWTAIGVAGVQSNARTIVDPEALILATLCAGRSDARLFDEALDWTVRNSALLDVARLRRLGRNTTADQRRLLGVVARVAGLHGAGASLKRLPEEDFIAREMTAEYGSQPLFRSQGQAEAGWSEDDELFAEAGYLRPPSVLRGLSQRPDGTRPACLRFRARGLVGVGPRAEVLTYLWTHEWAHGRLIAERAAYGQAPVAEYLATLADVALAERRVDGRKTLYRLLPALRDLGSPPPVYVDWATGWPAITALLASLAPQTLSEDAAWTRVAEALKTNQVGLRAEGLGIEVGDMRGWAQRGSQELAASVELVIERLRALALPARGRVER